MSTVLKDLVYLANILDEAGFIKEANELDELIKKRKEDLKEESEVYSRMQARTQIDKGQTDLLKKLFMVAVNDANKPSITNVSLKDIFTVLDESAQQSQVDPRIVKPEEKEYVSPETMLLAEGLATLEVDLDDMIKEIQDPNLNDQERKRLEMDIRRYQHELQVNYGVLEGLKISNPNAYSKVISHIKQKKQNRTSPTAIKIPELRHIVDRRG